MQFDHTMKGPIKEVVRHLELDPDIEKAFDFNEQEKSYKEVISIGYPHSTTLSFFWI